ncbi:hypothetical protein K491DRAFT_698280 [Lophiostoma macrostomum CBS 122681]|uniref:GILT-domain-containing protein n=1 Tax=Lophiostoma macrostomum CBS 122681 TaxID=1314788 RepID=A0A6A6SNG1_9PLEO|nr:hypothetical protein K491DRAFT_698280 [Lophiostoma macrostomum CBS 122681]
MDEKVPLLPQTEDATMRRPTPKRFSRFHAAAFAFVVGLFWLARTWQCADPFHHHEDEAESKVPLEIHIMSKCPDARDCLEKLVVPAMANVSDKVDFRLSFIGKTTDEDDGVQCMHGQTECLGNILELCAASEYPDPKIYLGFTMCLSRQYQKIPKKELVEDCALEHGMDFDTLNDCMSREDGAYGMDMLRTSVQRSADLNATISCTVRLDNKKRCIRDGGKWKDCEGGSKPEDLIRDIDKLYKESKGWTE